MALTAAERMARTRARRRGELETYSCHSCGKMLKPSGTGRAMAEGLCFACWAGTPDGKKFLADQRQLRRTRNEAPKPYRYFGAPPGEEMPEGPFNRMRLAVSSAYIGKGKPRGKVWIVWTDDVVTEHMNVRQADVGTITRDDGEEVDRSDLAVLARELPALTERTRHHGKGDVYLY